MEVARGGDLTRAAVVEHISAFNAHDTDRLLRGLRDDVVWATGSDVFRGRASLVDVFDGWLWSLQPRLDVLRTIVDGDEAAVECVEHMLVDGRRNRFHIAVLFTVREGLLSEVKVFREGTADIDDPVSSA